MTPAGSSGSGGPPDPAVWAVSVPLGYRVGVWRVTEPIATGSWGSVYAASRIPDAQPVGPETDPAVCTGVGLPKAAALKFVPTGTLTTRQINHLAQMAAREAGFSSTTTGRHLVRTYQVLTVDDPARADLDGAVVLVMNRARSSLQTMLEAATAGVALAGAARMIADIAAGLAEMHTAGWVHGDLKPANVLITTDDSLALADFGLAAELEGTHGYAPPAGSHDYLPPERRGAHLTERGVPTRASADIWALGVTAHQLLSGGTHPFPGATAAARAAAAAEYANGQTTLRLAAQIPPPWRGFIADCLAPDHPTRATHDAHSLHLRARALANSPAATPTPATPAAASPQHETHRWGPRLRRALPAAACTLALLGAGGGATPQHSPGIGPAGRPAAGPASPGRAEASDPAINPRCTTEDLHVRDDADRLFTHGRTCHAYASSPVYANINQPRPGRASSPLDDTGYMHGQTDVWVICQRRGRENPVIAGNHNRWWLYTQADAIRGNNHHRTQAWGYLPATALAQGGEYDPIPGVPVCTHPYGPRRS